MTENNSLDLFHSCAAWAYWEAKCEGASKHLDSEYVRKKAYKYYEEELRNERLKKDTEKTQNNAGASG